MAKFGKTIGKVQAYAAYGGMKVAKGLNKVKSSVKGMMTRDKRNYVDTSVGVARPAGFKSSVGVVNNVGKYNNRSNKNTAPSKSALQASLSKYAGKRQNGNSRRTSNPKSKAAFEASTKAYAGRNWTKF
jgi:hypothetical protein